MEKLLINRSWRMDIGSFRLEIGSWKMDVGSWKLKDGSLRLEIGSWNLKFDARDSLSPQIPSSKISLWVPLLIVLQLLTSNFPILAQQPNHELNPYLILSAENNPELKALFNDYLAALEEVKQEGVLPDPQLNFGYFIQPIETRVGPQRATASFSQMFPWFGTLDAQQKVAAEEARIALHMFNVKKMELYRDIRITYNDLYYLQQAIKVTEENLQLLESLKSLAQVYFESGKSGFSSVLQVQMEEEELRNKLDYLQDSKIPLITEFEQLLNTDLEEPVNFPDSLWEEPLALEKSEIFDVILANNPRLVHLVHEGKTFEYEEEVAQKMGMPSISIGMSYTNIAPRTDLEPNMQLSNNGQDAFIFPQIGIRMPIYRKKYKAMQKQAVLQQEAVELRKENVKNEVLTELELLYQEYLNAQRNIRLYKRLSTIARQSVDLLQTDLSTGKSNVFEIIRMERQLLNYRLELEKARTEKNNNVYRMNYLMGEKYEQDR